MKFSATPYNLNLRRAHHLQVVLFGAFVYCYVAHLQAFRLLRFLGLGDSAVTPTMLGLAAAVIAMMLLAVVSRSVHLPKAWSGRHRLIVCIVTAFTVGLLTSPSEEEGALDLAAYYARRGNYDKALKVYADYPHPTTAMLRQRAALLEASNRGICEEFFTFPLGHAIPSDEANRISPISSHTAADHHTHLNLLLRRNLDYLAVLLQHTPVDSLQRAEVEALVLYKHLRSNPIVVINDENIEANYRDFCEYERKLKASPRHYTAVEIANLLGDVYGDTYWHYYFYGKYR